MLVDPVTGRGIFTLPRKLEDWTPIVRRGPVKIADSMPNAVYANQWIAQGSKIGPGSFLIGCILGDYGAGPDLSFQKALVLRERCTLVNCNVRNKIYVGDDSIIRTSWFGCYNHLGSNCRVSRECFFGEGTEIDSSSTFGPDVSFGDNTRILHWNRFYGTKFGKNTYVGTGNHFHQYCKFEGIKGFEKDNLVINQDLTSTDRRVIPFAEYLEKHHLLPAVATS